VIAVWPSDAGAALLSTGSTELMLLPPRIQLLLCREYNESTLVVPAVLSHSPSVHAADDLNVQQKPYPARGLSHCSVDSSRPIRLISSLRVRNETAAAINYFATLDRGAF
jgi:hypothetical protein